MSELYDPLIGAANTFLDKGFYEDIDISPMKLQKLMYFLYRDYLQTVGRPFFSERFEAWKYGPALPRLYALCKKYGSSPISDYCRDVNGEMYKLKETHNTSAFHEAFSRVWQTYKNLSGIEMSELTHRPGTAWYTTWQKYENIIADQLIMLEEAILP